MFIFIKYYLKHLENIITFKNHILDIFLRIGIFLDKKSKNKAKPAVEYFTKTDDDEAKPKNDLEYTSRETMFEEKPDDPSEKKDPDSEKNI